MKQINFRGCNKYIFQPTDIICFTAFIAQSRKAQGTG